MGAALMERGWKLLSCGKSCRPGRKVGGNRGAQDSLPSQGDRKHVFTLVKTFLITQLLVEQQLENQLNSTIQMMLLQMGKRTLLTLVRVEFQLDHSLIN
jgi:hypothetical protein